MKKYKTTFSNEELHNALHSKESEAKDIIENVDKLKESSDIKAVM